MRRKDLKFIEEDEYHVTQQYEDMEDYNGQKELLQLYKLIPTQGNYILEIGCGNGDLFGCLPITHGLEPNSNRLSDAQQRGEMKVQVKRGWAEDLPYDSIMFHAVVCWGTLCFVESLMKTLMETNRVLKADGYFILDAVTYTTMPLPQTVNPYSFQRFIKMFSFEIEAMIPFGERYHQRVGYLLRKTGEYNYKKLLMPQIAEGKVNNYLEERDWYLR